MQVKNFNSYQPSFCARKIPTQPRLYRLISREAITRYIAAFNGIGDICNKETLHEVGDAFIGHRRGGIKRTTIELVGSEHKGIPLPKILQQALEQRFPEEVNIIKVATRRFNAEHRYIIKRVNEFNNSQDVRELRKIINTWIINLSKRVFDLPKVGVPALKLSLRG